MRRIDFDVTQAVDVLSDKEQGFQPLKPVVLLYFQEHVHNMIVVKKKNLSSAQMGLLRQIGSLKIDSIIKKVLNY